MKFREWLRKRTVEPEPIDSVPNEAYVSGSQTLSIREELQRFVRSELSRKADENDQDSWEESNDLDVDNEEGPDMMTAYELVGEYEENLDGDVTAPEPLAKKPVPEEEDPPKTPAPPASPEPSAPAVETA